MAHRFFALLFLPALLLLGSPAVRADASHARIIRLSLVQGDVRFTRDAHGDALSDASATWETAALNLPIRQGYVIATGNGRAEIEFENGAMVFLNEHSALEFYDLSLNDGGLTTRLILRQGSISAHAHPTSADYFSVTGGDFTVEATSRATFRVDNFDDGSTVSVIKGHVSVLHNNETSALEKNQSLTMHAGNDAVSIDRAADNDSFDQWVSGRIDSVSTATNTSLQYVNSPYYNSGFADLSMYGQWYPIGGFGNCWRPYGAAFGWSPFDAGMGSWYYDPFFGWSFIGYQPWGWAPYHYGSWIFANGMGWVWVPSGFGYRRNPWRPVTATFVRSGSSVGLVPTHPTDKRGKTPVNITQGVLNVPGSKISGTAIAAGEKWKVSKTAPREVLASSVTPAAPPTRVSRTVPAGISTGAAHVATPSQTSSITYDPREHRYVNENNAASTLSSEKREAKESSPAPASDSRVPVTPCAVSGGPATATPPPSSAARPAAAPPAVRPAVTPPPARSIVPPPARTGGGSSGGSSPSRGGNSGNTHSAPASAPAAHASSPAPSHSSGRPR